MTHVKLFGYLAGASALALTTSLSSQALAQTKAPAAESNAEPAALEEVVVTARRREEAAQSVPVAVTALSANQLQRASVTTVEDLQNVVPGLHTMSTSARSNQVSFVIRGQTEGTGYITNDPAVGLYFAEAVQMRPQGTARSLYDLDSVQVLKGPQGTLFGRNTTGGAVLIQPKAPVLGAYEGYAEAILGNYNRHDAQGAINIPLGETVALRLAAATQNQDGYVTNLTTGSKLSETKNYAFRASLLFKPSDNFRNTLILDQFYANQNGTPIYVIAVNPTPPRPLPAAFTAAFLRQQGRDMHTVENNVDPLSKARNFGATNVTEFEVGSLTFKNVAAYRKVSGLESLDSDGSPVSLVAGYDDLKVKQYSEEFQVQGEAFSDRLKYIVGLYYFNESGRDIPTIIVSGVTPGRQISKVDNTSKSVFAQGDYDLGGGWSATAGGRYTWDERGLNQTVMNAAGTACALCADLKKNFSAPTWTLGLNYKPNGKTLIYLANRRGYRSGGFNGQGTTLAQLTPYNAETVTDVELGIKADWTLLGAPIRTNLAAYRSYYDNIQRQVSVVINGAPTRTIFNAAKATVTGAELETNYLPTRNLELSGFLGYTDGKYDEFTDPVSRADLSGLPFARMPKITWRVAARYHVPTDVVDMHVGLNYTWMDNISWNDSAILPGYMLPSYGLLNGRVEFDNVGRKGLRLAFYANNITNKDYRTSAIAAYPNVGYTASGIGTPRMYGLELGYRF